MRKKLDELHRIISMLETLDTLASQATSARLQQALGIQNRGGRRDYQQPGAGDLLTLVWQGWYGLSEGLDSGKVPRSALSEPYSI
jgi:hypothetical protein